MVAYALTLLILDLWLFFLLYVACMNMIKAHKEKKVTGVLWLLCLPAVAIGLIVDFLHQITIFNVVFWDVPRDPTVTGRLKRHIADPGYRGKLARYLCVNVLSPFDHTGNHCD